MATFTPVQTGMSRVFLIENRAGPTHKPSYESCLKAGGIDYGLGDIEKIECPDPNRYGQFVEIGSIRGAEERPTTSLSGRYALDLASTLLRLARKRCNVDTQIHFGQCQDPSQFNDFDKVLILEDVAITNYSTEDLGALASDENAKVDESVDLSARRVYEFLPLSYASKAGDTITNQLIDVIIADSASCGDCTAESDGCQKIFAISLAAGGSPSTPADVVFSLDGGQTWYAHDIDSLGVSSNPDGVAAVGEYLVVISADDGSIEYALISEFDGTTDPSFTTVTTGFVSGGEPQDIWSTGNHAFIVGKGGYIYETDDPTSGVTVLDAGVAVQDDLNAVHALSSTFAVAVGNASAIVKTENGTAWEKVTPPTPVSVNYNCVWVKSEKEWWIGASNGNLYYTTDGGQTWSTKAFSGSGAGQVRDIAFASDSVAYLAHDTATPKGRILESCDGGYSWTVAPRGIGSFPVNDQVTALAACTDNVNFVVGVGLADDGSDGFIAVGSA